MQRRTGNETAKFQEKIKHFLGGKGIDIGCGRWPLDYPYLDTLDIDAEVNPTFVSSAEKVPVPNETYNFVYSSHCLEHTRWPRKVLKEWIRILKVNGLLILFLPHKYFYPNVRDPEGNASHWQDFRPEDIIFMLDKIGRTYLIEIGTIAEKVTPRWEKRVGYPLKREFNQYSFYVVACKKKEKFFESFCLEGWLNKIIKIVPAVKNKLRICKHYFGIRN